MSTVSTGAPGFRSRANAITVDVEEWFHICGVGSLSRDRWDDLPSRVVLTTRALLEDLDRAGTRATFFVVGWIAERYPELVGEIRAAGHDIGSHGHLHTRVYELDQKSFVADLRRSVAALRAAGVERIAGFRAPEWSINRRSLWALECLVRERITLDASMAPVRMVGSVEYAREPHVRQTPAGPLLEVPPLVVDRFGQAMPIGWGWGLRMTSPRRMLHTIDAVNAAGLPAVLTVHPWEIDPRPPQVALPLRLRFAHYFRLDGFRERLAAVLAAGDFGALSDVPALQASPVIGAARSMWRLEHLALAALTTCAMDVVTVPALAQDVSPLPRIAIDESIAEARTAESGALPFAHLVRLAGAVNDRMLEERVAADIAGKTPVWVAVEAPLSIDAVEPWRVALQDLLRRHGDGIAILEIETGADARITAFALRLAATEVRAARESIQVALNGVPLSQPGALTGLYTAEIAPYVDLLVLSAKQAAAASDLLKVDSGVRLAILAGDAGNEPEAITRRLIESQLDTIGTEVAVVAWRSSGLLGAALRRLAPMAPLMAGDITPLDPAAAGLELSRAGGDVTASTPHRLLFDNRSFATYLAYWGDPSPIPLDVTLTLPVEGAPVLYRLLDGTRIAASEYSRDATTGRVHTQVPVTGGPMLIDFNAEAPAIYIERSGVSAQRQLSVQEIIARHQQQQRAQDSVVRNYTASARSEQHFRPTMTDPGYDVVTDNRYYVGTDGIEWEELSFSVNGSKWGADRPPFPLLQPEKVLSLPLQLRFGDDYRYRLEGTARVGDYDCYVVRFDPIGNGQSLYRGTMWIERNTFARVKVSAVQTGLSAPVVSNEEIQTYAPIASVGNRPVFLFTGLTARQIILIAGRNILVEKAVAFRDFRINDPNFDESRSSARRGDGVMYRETDQGLRYFVKEGNDRVVSDRATRSARAMAMGVTLDPSYAFPLPIVGINYLNFEFRGRQDTQLALLFAGVLAAGNIQRPKVRRLPLDASIDFFAIAVPSSDRVYDASGERAEEALLTWPLTTGLNLGWQYTPFQKLSTQYQFRFDGFVADRTTSAAFVVPTSTITNGVGGGWEYRRGGYSLVANATWFSRVAWRTWGLAPDPASGPRYAKYSANLSRDFYFNTFHKVHLNSAWFGGRDLDRFAKYQFGMFDDTRIHGVPASGARFAELAMVRGSYSFNIFDQYRVDIFLERAAGRDRALDAAWQPITGTGLALNLRAPWDTILRVDAGKSFLPERYRRIGSATLQILLLKPLH